MCSRAVCYVRTRFPPLREREYLKTPTVLVLEHFCCTTSEVRWLSGKRTGPDNPSAGLDKSRHFFGLDGCTFSQAILVDSGEAPALQLYRDQLEVARLREVESRRVALHGSWATPPALTPAAPGSASSGARSAVFASSAAPSLERWRRSGKQGQHQCEQTNQFGHFLIL